MDLKAVYDQVRERLDALDFAALWRGFHPLPFALYTESACYFDGAYVEKTDEFLANTTIEYRGGPIAIWNMDTALDDLDVLASDLAHEMFHAFQKESGESRWANEIAALADYRYDALNVSGRLREAELMRRIVRGGEHSLFAELLALRQARARRFPREYDYEARVEQIEGSARYVELCALKQLDAEKAARAWEKLWAALAKPERYVPARVISYSSGAALLACICACSDYDFSSFTPVPFAQGVLAEAPDTAPELAVDARAAQAVAAYEAETHAIIEGALRKNRVVLQGRFPLESLNVYDARQAGRYAVSNHFVAYRDGDAPHALYGSFVVELDGTDILTVYAQ